MKKAIIIALSLVIVLAVFTSCEEPKHEHTWNDGEVTTVATCVEKGVKTFTCTVCKETKTEEIPVDPNNHTWNDGEVTTVATCVEKGVKTFTCTSCEKTKTEEIPALGHAEQVVTVEPGYLSKGSKTTTCSRCDYEVVEELDRKSLTGKWMTAALNETEVVYLAFSEDVSAKSKIYMGLSTICKTVSGEDCFMLFDLGLDFVYSLDFSEEDTKIKITNDTEHGPFNQTCSISEEDINGESKITIKNINISGTIGDVVFSVISAHNFPVSEVYDTWLHDEGSNKHVGGWMCIEDIKEDELRLVLIDMESTGTHNESGKGGSCSICGYTPAE